MKTNTKMLIGMISALAGTFIHAQVLRPYTGANGTLWSNSGSWASGLPVNGNNVSYRNTATGTHIFDLTSGFTILNVGVASRSLDTTSSNSVTTTLNLNTRTLNATSLAVGETNGSSSFTGNFTVGNGTLNLGGGTLRVGVRTSSNSITGNGTLTGTSLLNFSSTGMTSFQVGTTNHQSGIGLGTLNFTNVASGTLRVSGSSTATDRVIIGGRLAGASGGNGTTGTVTLGNNWTATTFGTSTAARTNMLVGYRNGNGSASGTFTQSGGSFAAYAAAFYIGSSTNFIDNASIFGSVNLTGTHSALIDTQSLHIGNGNSTTGSYAPLGALTLGEGGAVVAVTTVVGRAATGAPNTQASIDLDKASFTVASTGTLTINRRARIDATVKVNNPDGTSVGGIIINNPISTALVIDSLTTEGRGLLLNFEGIDAGLWQVGSEADYDIIYHALRWKGADRSATLESFFANNKIDCDASALIAQFGSDPVAIIYDGTDTYVGVLLKASGGGAMPVQWLGMNLGNEGTAASTQLVMNDFNAVGLGAVRKGNNVSTSPPSTALTNQDGTIDTLYQAGMQIHWVINYRGNGINPSGTGRTDLPNIDINGSTMNTWFNNYKQRCIDLFTRYSPPGNEKILYYIVGNEPNLGDNFTSLEGRPDIAVKLTQAMYEAAQQVNPNIKVQSSPVSQPDAPYLQQMINLGVANYCDIIGVHVYGSQTHPGRIDKPWQWLQAAGITNKPVGISEAGVTTGWNPSWSSNARQWQSDWLNNFYVMAKRYGYSYGILFTHDDDHTADWALLRAAGAQVQPSWNEIANTLTNPQGLRNASFETPNDVRRQWYPEHNPDTNWPTGFNWQYASNPKSGTYCAQIRTNTGWSTSAHQVVDNLIPGTTYRVSAWIRSESPSGGHFYVAGSQALNGTQTFSSSTVTANSWTKVSVDVTPTNPWIVISLTTKKNSTTRYAYFDDISVTPL